MKYIKRSPLLLKKLNESDDVKTRSKSISLKDSVEYYMKFCSDYDLNIPPMYRGIRYSNVDDFLTISPSKYHREAAYTNGTYKNLIDNNKYWDTYPSRSKSVIFTNSIFLSDTFGSDNTFIIIPKNGSSIAVSPSYDFQESFEKFYDKFGFSLISLEEIFRDEESPYNSVYLTYDEIVDRFKNEDYNIDIFKPIYKNFIIENNLSGIDILEDMFKTTSPKFNYFKLVKMNRNTNLYNKFNLPYDESYKFKFINYDEYTPFNTKFYEDNSREFWTDSDCLLIRLSKYELFLEEVHKLT